MHQTHQVCQCGAFDKQLQVEKCCSRPVLEALCGDFDLYESYPIRAECRRYPLHVLLVEIRVSKSLNVGARVEYKIDPCAASHARITGGLPDELYTTQDDSSESVLRYSLERDSQMRKDPSLHVGRH